MSWEVIFTPQAHGDLQSSDNSQLGQVFKASKKVFIVPLPYIEGGYGKPLRNHSSHKLAELLKIKLLKP